MLDRISSLFSEDPVLFAPMLKESTYVQGQLVLVQF